MYNVYLYARKSPMKRDIYIMAQLQLMYEAACQQLPNYRNEWTRVKEMCANGLRELWKTDDSKK